MRGIGGMKELARCGDRLGLRSLNKGSRHLYYPPLIYPEETGDFIQFPLVMFDDLDSFSGSTPFYI